MSKKIFFLLSCALIFQSLPVFSQNFEFYNTQNAGSVYNSRNNDCTDYPVVSKIERNMLGRTFRYENIYQRVNRLESSILGASFPQEALCDRIDRLTKAVSVNDSSLGSQYQSLFNSFGNNSSCGNQYYASSQNQSTLQKILEYAIPFISEMAANNYGSNNYSYNPDYTEEYNNYRNTNFGTRVRILP